MNKYREILSRAALSADADERIRDELLRASSADARKKRVRRDRCLRSPARAVLTALLLIAALGVTAYAVGARIIMKAVDRGDTSAVTYLAADEFYVELGAWAPGAIPDGYAVSFVSDPFYGSQAIVYSNGEGNTIRFEYARPGALDVSMENVLRREKIRIGGAEGLLYSLRDSRDLFWANDVAGVGYRLFTDDPGVDLPALACSVEEQDAPPVPTRLASTEQALKELGDYSVTALPAGFDTVETVGCPTSEGGGWYGYVRKSYTNKADNGTVHFSYETSLPAEGTDCGVDRMLETANVDGDRAEINGFPGVISKDGRVIVWVDSDRSLLFTLTSDALSGEELTVLADSVS